MKRSPGRSSGDRFTFDAGFLPAAAFHHVMKEILRAGGTDAAGIQQIQESADGRADIHHCHVRGNFGDMHSVQFKLELNRRLAPEIYKEDSTSQDVLKWIYDHFGSIDIMVHASGGGFSRYTMENTDKDYWHRTATISENLFFNTMYALPYLEKSKSPVMINVVSDEGYHGGWFNNPACASARGSVVTLTKEMARELAPKGIRVNCVVHSHIDGDGPDASEAFLNNEEREKIVAATPLKRLCTREDIAGIINFLASDAASFITGAVVPVNGGLEL